MPEYTIACRACGHEFIVVRSMTSAPTPGMVHCIECGSKDTSRVFKPIQVIPNEFPNPLPVWSLRPTNGQDTRGVQTVSSRSELAKMEKKHDEMYGTKLEHAG